MSIFKSTHITCLNLIGKGENMVDIFKVLGDENRLKILSLLMFSELCVCELEVLLDLSQSNVSRHLAKLKGVGLISSEKNGQWIHYKTSQSFKEEHSLLWRYLNEHFKENPEIKEVIKKSKKYHESGFNCQNITHDKAVVITYLKQEENNE